MFNYFLWPEQICQIPLTEVHYHLFPAMYQFSLIFYIEVFHSLFMHTIDLFVSDID